MHGVFFTHPLLDVSVREKQQQQKKEKEKVSKKESSEVLFLMPVSINHRIKIEQQLAYRILKNVKKEIQMKNKLPNTHVESLSIIK